MHWHVVKPVERPRRRGVAGFTLLELMVAVGVMVVLATLFASSLSRATSFARSAACKSNLRQQAFALSMYVHEYQRYPLSQDSRVGYDSIRSGQAVIVVGAWSKLLKPLIQSPPRLTAEGKAFLCPERERVTIDNPRVELSSAMPSTPKSILVNGTYGYNGYGTGLNRPDLDLGLGKEWEPAAGKAAVEVAESKVQAPGNMIAISDGSALSTLISPVVSKRSPLTTLRLLPAPRHSRRVNVAFCDGHVEAMGFRSLVAANEEARRRWNNDHEPHRETW